MLYSYKKRNRKNKNYSQLLGKIEISKLLILMSMYLDCDSFLYIRHINPQIKILICALNVGFSLNSKLRSRFHKNPQTIIYPAHSCQSMQDQGHLVSVYAWLKMNSCSVWILNLTPINIKPMLHIDYSSYSSKWSLSLKL